MLQSVGAVALAGLAPAALAARARADTRHVIGDLQVFRLPVNHRGDWLIVRLATARGALTGVGDASHGGDNGETIGFLRQFAGMLRGQSIFDVERFRAATRDIVDGAPGASAIVAASALEHCLWDLIGKALDTPTYNLFGGALNKRIPLYANINRSTLPRTPEAFGAMAAHAIRDGFDAVKLAPFDAIPADPAARGDIAPLTEQGFACAQAVRAAIGPGRKLLIDAHSRFNRAQGVELAKRFEPFDLFWLEEVTPAEPIDDLVAINRSATMPTAGGEAVRGVRGFYPYAKTGAVDIVMPDVKICGGMLELKKIAALAEGAGLLVSPHGPASPIGNLAAAHVAATLPNFNILEFSYGEVPWRAELLVGGEAIVGGAMHLGHAPGIGATLNDVTVARRVTPL